jgi:hypothetical protein
MTLRIVKYRFLFKAILAILILCACPKLYGQYNENLVKAAYIERMTRFVDWPDSSAVQRKGDFIIGVFGDNDFFVTLTTAFKGKQIKNLIVRVVQVKSIDQLSACYICYLSEKAENSLGSFISAANSSGVLLVSESDAFGREGVHINFYIENEKLKFEINQTSINSAGFKVSYLLLQNTRVLQ